MKHSILRKLMLIALLLTSSQAFAHDFEVGGIYYNFLSKTDKSVEVTYRGNSSLDYEEYAYSETIPQTVTYNNITYKVTSIGKEAFAYCYGLTSVTIPNSVTSIGESAFRICFGLTSVTIGNSVTSIGEEAFYDCYRLTSVTIGNSVTSIGEYAFAYCEGLTSITIPNSVTSIGDGAFSWCSELASIEIPNSITRISNAAFFCCYGLTSVTIPNSVTSIGGDAFSGCHDLTSITIPNSITSIGYYAFANCSVLEEIICESVTPATADNNTFTSVPTTATLYVPIGSRSAYANATGWSYFTNIVEDDVKTGVESTLVDDVNVSVENGNIVINGADNAKIEVYSVNGQCVYRGTATTIPVTVKGLYIVKVNGKSFKVML